VARHPNASDVASVPSGTVKNFSDELRQVVSQSVHIALDIAGPGARAARLAVAARQLAALLVEEHRLDAGVPCVDAQEAGHARPPVS
jgi:hypothetical protein